MLIKTHRTIHSFFGGGGVKLLLIYSLTSVEAPAQLLSFLSHPHSTVSHVRAVPWLFELVQGHLLWGTDPGVNIPFIFLDIMFRSSIAVILNFHWWLCRAFYSCSIMSDNCCRFSNCFFSPFSPDNQCVFIYVSVLYPFRSWSQSSTICLRCLLTPAITAWEWWRMAL